MSFKLAQIQSIIKTYQSEWFWLIGVLFAFIAAIVKRRIIDQAKLTPKNKVTRYKVS